MNPAVKEKWVAALRSTAYKQGKHQLRNDKNEFCCLGVLCNLHAQAHPEIAMRNNDFQNYDGSNVLPSKRVFKWAGLESQQLSPPLGYKGWTHQTLASANDAGVPFSVIADHIEKYF